MQEEEKMVLGRKKCILLTSIIAIAAFCICIITQPVSANQNSSTTGCTSICRPFVGGYVALRWSNGEYIGYAAGGAWTGTQKGGAVWKKYEFKDSDKSGDKYVVKVPGQGPYAPGGVITCPTTATHYYRYAQVAYATGSYNSTDGGGNNSLSWSSGQYSSGDQVGIGSIGNTGANAYRRSEFFHGGSMRYRGTKAEWNDMKKRYKGFKHLNSDDTNNKGWSATSNLGWFCGYKDLNGTAKFRSNSKVTVNLPSDASIKAKSSNVVKSSSTKVYLKSGWNKTAAGNITYKGSNQVTVTGGHTIQRKDGNDGGGGLYSFWTHYQLWNYSNKSYNNSTPKPQTSLLQNKKKYTVPTSGSTKSTSVSIKPAKAKKVCARIGISRSLKYNKQTGAVISRADMTSPSSKACITVTHRPGAPIATTVDSYVGESTKVRYSGTLSGKTHRVIFYLGQNVGQNSLPGSNSVKKVEDVVIATKKKSTSVTNDWKAVLCDDSSRLSSKRTGECSEQSSNSVDPMISDNVSMIGMKICAAAYNHWAEPDGTTYTVHIVDERDEDGKETKGHDEERPYYTWFYALSAISCNPIFAKPNFRVTNGNLYAADSVSGILATKGGTNYTSWGEYLSVIGDSDDKDKDDEGDIEDNHVASSFGSGGHYRNGNSNTNNDSPLTVANNNPSRGNGNAGISSRSEAFIDELHDRYSEARDRSNYNIIRDNLSQDVKIGGSGGIGIPGDCGTASKQCIIFAKNIFIDPSVETINALLIADDTINTCYGPDNIDNLNYSSCSRPLKINGITYARNFKLFRTIIGTQTQRGSNYSAEEFSLTANVYRWGYQQAQQQRAVATEVSRQELAPRI